ncbi:uncharacterized protein L969DRAFT_93773 [Mixia osmundae IAM 14324]|uniref:NADH-ubiquinone oxidoreductase 12 kDa subunit n=1 Tax=Mixia osmundae (strain CBS 9802 / IAM 14324 / JCM 22182 / KY 12970) TaxID=764103 RepID=G7E9J1_MIXOS|nr:uncharacterized protein L969DRAFT_93773 [Mixia osmundae IAM 14324]KEI39942.1 hypothetical protein L969DRAFT_93773 [Mixia osmundae IAM 14324]GAA99310.1 hypothetical protein E5Q_06005 [Mixia osmundae IAM 14324]
MSTSSSGHSVAEYKELLEARDAAIREGWVRTMEARLVREELGKCWRTEGVNHYAQCHELTQRYLDMLRTHRVKGTRVIDFES